MRRKLFGKRPTQEHKRPTPANDKPWVQVTLAASKLMRGLMSKPDPRAQEDVANPALAAKLREIWDANPRLHSAEKQLIRVRKSGFRMPQREKVRSSMDMEGEG